MLRNSCLIGLFFILAADSQAEVLSPAVVFAVSALLQPAVAGESSDLILFIGRFHPLLVHLPIGFLLLAFLLECFGRLERFQEAGLENAVPFSLLSGGISAIGAVLTGYLLSLDGGYGEDLLSTHMWLGITVAVLSLSAFILRTRFFDRPKIRTMYEGILLLMVACLMAAGHYGGSLTHGSDYLTRHMPEPLRSVAGLPPKRKKGIKKIEDLDSAQVFTDVIHPILDTRCVTCHNPEKKKGELLLTSYDELMKGGENGPVLQAGSADSSNLVYRLLLPEADDDHMPPEGKLQLTGDQIDLIAWWIDQGAPIKRKISELEVPKHISEALNKLTVKGTPFLAGTNVPGADSTVVNQLRSRGIEISLIVRDKNFLQVKYPESADSVYLKQLLPLSQQVVWLDLAKTTVEDSSLAVLTAFKNLTRLNLEHTKIGDPGLKALNTLKQLKYLNLYKTEVSDTGLKYLAENPRLESLYVWQTKITPRGVEELQQQLSDLYVDTGWGKAGTVLSEKDSNAVGR
ncbi:Uncharacterized membrane protein [Fodinibius roseus]|uniref:Uncharacterized membrane protein n=1 Tax=Fodinibius roseus TaxID=1194090 RepID=A0A1M5FLC5_9BACT|nr:Uncharacterized membrane protein [Fodinibius roseus]